MSSSERLLVLSRTRSSQPVDSVYHHASFVLRDHHITGNWNSDLVLCNNDSTIVIVESSGGTDRKISIHRAYFSDYELRPPESMTWKGMLLLVWSRHAVLMHEGQAIRIMRGVTCTWGDRLVSIHDRRRGQQEARVWGVTISTVEGEKTASVVLVHSFCISLTCEPYSKSAVALDDRLVVGRNDGSVRVYSWEGNVVASAEHPMYRSGRGADRDEHASILNMLQWNGCLAVVHASGFLHLWTRDLVLLKRVDTGGFFVGLLGGRLVFLVPNQEFTYHVWDILPWSPSGHGHFGRRTRETVRCFMMCSYRRTKLPIDVVSEIFRWYGAVSSHLLE